MRSFALLVAVVVVALLLGNVQCHSPDEWVGRRIYQLLTDRFSPPDPSSPTQCRTMDEYCGGTHSGITAKLDYISGMGFNAIWISPIPVNFKGGYHGYWAIDFTKVNPHFGSADELKSMIEAAHAKGIWVMADIVVNHVGPVGSDFSNVVPFNKNEHYHSTCQVSNYMCFTEEVYNCRLADLPDLNQSVPFVKQQLQTYIQWLVNKFHFDGMRADTVMYIEQAYWAGLTSAAKTFITGEVWADFDCQLRYTQYGVHSTLNYALYNTLRNVWQHGYTMRDLGNVWRLQQSFPHTDWEVNFIDNHDNDRFLNATNDINAYKSAIAHMYFTNGIPCIYYGTEQLFSGGIRDNYCRQPLWPTKFAKTDMYDFFFSLNMAYEKLSVTKYKVEERWQDDSVYCYIRGPMLMCTTNRKDQQVRTIPNLPFEGMNVCDWFYPKACIKGSGTMTITVPEGGMPLLLYGSSS